MNRVPDEPTRVKDTNRGSNRGSNRACPESTMFMPPCIWERNHQWANVAILRGIDKLIYGQAIKLPY